MKSRFLLPNKLSVNNRLPASEGGLMRSDARCTDASVARRFELQHNVSPRFARRRAERRQGQALLLAVLIMLLAALLSAGFLAVVSGNLNQSARIADKTRAIEASRAGIAYANAQLSDSSQGDLWRPLDVSPVPVPGVPATAGYYDQYYSQLDKVQGWANNLTPPARTDSFPNAAYPVPTYEKAVAYYRNAVYAKFPAPSQAIGDAPKFLVKVEEVPLNPLAANYDARHAGELKITSIGLSDDDPNVFHKAIAYKAGRLKSPFAQALRSISNWDFERNRVPSSPVAKAVTILTPTANVPVPVRDTTAFSNDNVPFNIVIVKKDFANPANSQVRGAVVTQVTPPAMAGDPATLTLARVDTSIGTDETIQKAAAIGTASTIDLLNTGQQPTPAVPLTFPTQTQPNGILANGSVWLQNQIQLSNLSATGTKLFASGSLAIDDSAATAQKEIVQNSGDIGPTNTTDPTSNKLVPSSRNGFPGNIVLTAAAASNGVQPTDLIRDGWNKIGSQTLGLDYSNSRDVEPFKPAKIDSAENLARYRALTRNSANGVYIDNRDDVEKVGTDEMTQAQLVEMLTKPTSTPAANYARNDAASAAATGVSLEQRHLRGWVGPDEFLARGALVELVQATGGNPYLRVTYDARSDTNFNGPELSKAFRDNNGNLQPGVYVKNLAWPTNGTLFAEGNIRIRGNVNLPAAPTDGSPDLYPSLTVVSLNNIYIEGALSVDSSLVGMAPNQTPDPNRKKLMLLAKENVIVNPTRAVLARTDVQTVTNSVAPVTVTVVAPPTVDFTLDVKNAISFNIGDYVKVQATPRDIRGVVTNVIGDTRLVIRTPDSGTVAANSIVSAPLEQREAGTGPSVQAFYSLVDTENAFNRRIYAPLQNATLNKLVFDHVADLRKNPSGATVGLRVKAVDYAVGVPLPTTGLTADLTDKQTVTTTGGVDTVDPTQFNVTQADKKIRIYNSFDGGSKDEFNEPPADKTLTLFANDISAFMGRTDGAMIAPKGYKYQGILNEDTAPLVDPDLNARLSSIGTLPYYALAGVGLRYAPGPPTGFVNGGRKTLTTDNNPPTTVPPTPADATPEVSTVIPLATSVEFDLNSTLSSLITSTSTSPVPTPVPYLGFNPNFAEPDDALTVDSTFYQTKDDVVNSTLDQRVLNLPNPTTSFIHSVVLKRSDSLAAPALSKLLPDYRIRASKLENYNIGMNYVRPVVAALNINAFVYAQEGSWFIIPGDYFRSTPAVRSIATGTGNATRLSESYIDYNNNNNPDAGEYIGAVGSRVADLNRNGRPDPGERSAALRLVRYNYFPVKFFGAIVENQTAIVADVENPTAGQPALVKGSVQDWMDKWVSYRDSVAANVGSPDQFTFIEYTYDPSILTGSSGANGLRIPITDDLLYQQ